METTVEKTEHKKKGKILIYFLAAKEESDECIAIRKYLTPVLRSAGMPIEINSDFEIPIDEDIANYKEKLYQADIVLALISADFINDDATYLRTQKVIERYNKGETILLPILVRNCLWKSTPFVKLTLLPRNLQPLNNKQFWNSEDDAFTAVVEGIYETIEKFIQQNSIPPPESEFKKTGDELSKPLQDKKQPEHTTEHPIRNFANEKITEPNTTNSTSKATGKAIETENDKWHFTLPVENVVSDLININWRKGYLKKVFLKRTAAFVIDQFMGLLLFLLALIPAGYLVDAILPDPTDQFKLNNIAPIVAYSVIISTSIYLLIVSLLETSKWRCTPGKKFLKLQISDKLGNPVSFFKALGRNIMKLILVFVYLFDFIVLFGLQSDTARNSGLFWVAALFGWILLLVNIYTYIKTKNLIHDQISKTVIGERLSN